MTMRNRHTSCSTHIAEILQVANKVLLGKDELVDRLLSLPLLRIDGCQELLRDARRPQCRPSIPLAVLLILNLSRLLQARLRRQVEELGLDNPSRAGDGVAERAVVARRRVAAEEDGEDARGEFLLVVQLERAAARGVVVVGDAAWGERGGDTAATSSSGSCQDGCPPRREGSRVGRVMWRRWETSDR